MKRLIWRSTGIHAAFLIGSFWVTIATVFAQDSAPTSIKIPLAAPPVEMWNNVSDVQPVQHIRPVTAVNSVSSPTTAPIQPIAVQSKSDVDPAVVRQIIADYLTELENKKKFEADQKRKEADEKGYEIGNNPTLSTTWENGLWFTSPNKDWRFHFGGRLQAESVFWNQPNSMKGPPPGNGGIPASAKGDGVGPLDDGMFFRRVRFRADGTGYETIEFVMEVDFEQLNFITFDHMWVGAKDLPFLGTVRLGQHKVPQGMEMMASDYHQTFLQDRSVLSEAFWNLFALGIFVSNDYLDHNVTTQSMFHRIQPTGFYTSDFGDGNYAASTRATWTPLYQNDGRHLVHVGGSYQWRTGDLGRTIQPGATGNTFADTQDVVRFRARPELRDATGIPPGNLGGDTARFVDTGFLLANNVQTVSPEFLLIWGAFSVQAEAAWAYSSNVRSIYPSSSFGTPRGNTLFWGGYVETSYFLTGENRGYDRRFGTFDRPKVNENAFAVRGDDGKLHYGTGAWQIAYRYSFVDLNDNGVNGGQMGQHTVGVNWYLNDNTKLQFQYSNIQRNVIEPAASGTVHGFGTLLQWYF
ncbi:MAG: hypothetical protein K8T89_10450 [Planctomycetes bacterium]|nr:hypothetical protein [Planctomycetota bacterium]